MKTITLISFLFLLLLFGNVKAQSYYPISDTNAVWDIVLYPDPEGPYPNNGYQSFISGVRNLKMIFCMIDGAIEVNYVKTGIEVINNNEYTKFVPDFLSGNLSFNLYLREDTLNGKLWALNETTNKEWLTINMSMKIGDTILLAHRYAAYNDTIAIVDSIFFDENGLKHILFNQTCFNFALSPEFNKLEFIEGIGSNFGLGFQILSPFIKEYQEILLCASLNGEKIYSHPSADGDSCTLLGFWDNIKSNIIPIINVWPNPCSVDVHFSFSVNNNQGTTILINDISGNLIYKSSYNSLEKEICISLGIFARGIYLVKVLQNNIIVYQTKIIITK